MGAEPQWNIGGFRELVAQGIAERNCERELRMKPPFGRIPFMRAATV